MALELSITHPVLEMNEVHTGTVVEVFEDEDKTIPIISETWSLPDSLTHKTYNIQLIPGHRYYAQARVILTPGGLQGMSNVTNFVGGDTNDITLHMHPPSLVRPPIVTVVNGNVDTQHTQLEFTQETIVATNHVIKHVSWVLTDSHNIIRFQSLEDTTNINSIRIDTVLKQTEVFIMRCMVTLDTGSTSMFGSVTFTTGKLEDGELRFDYSVGDFMDKSVMHPTYFGIYPIPDAQSNEITLYNNLGVIANYTSNGTLLPLTPYTDEVFSYVIKVTSLLQDGTILGPIYHYIYRDNRIDISTVSFPKDIPVQEDLVPE